MEQTLSSQADVRQARGNNAQLQPAGVRPFFETDAAEPGRFDLVPRSKRRSSDAARALMTGVLVLYPVFAIVAVVAAGFLLSAGVSS